MQQISLVILGLILFISCSKEKTNIEVVNSEIKEEIQIPENSTLKVNLGSFGDEEGVGIFKSPLNAQISQIERSANASEVIYNYKSRYNFVGRDTVILIIYRGSDGASTGNSVNTQIVINVVR
jgi:hypothetical protein